MLLNAVPEAVSEVPMSPLPGMRLSQLPRIPFIRRNPTQATENLDFVFGRNRENCFCVNFRTTSVNGFWVRPMHG